MELPPYSDFPPANLLPKLVDAYFNDINMYIPLLHRPTFERQLADGLHLRRQDFGAVVLLVCANGSKWVDDPRAADQNAPHKEAGARWAEQVQSTPLMPFSRPTVSELQACVVSINSV